jgi:hypothetical protein
MEVIRKGIARSESHTWYFSADAINTANRSLPKPIDNDKLAELLGVLVVEAIEIEKREVKAA